MMRLRQHALVEFPEPSIAPLGDEVVARVQYEGRQYAQRLGELPPAPDSAQYEQRSSCLGEQPLTGPTKVSDNVESVEIVRVLSISPHDPTRQVTLKGRKLELVPTIPLENELVQSIAQPADAIVENEMVGVGLA